MQLKEEAFILAHSLKVQSSMMRTSQRQKLESVCHVASVVRRKKAMDARAQLTSSFFNKGFWPRA